MPTITVSAAGRPGKLLRAVAAAGEELGWAVYELDGAVRVRKGSQLVSLLAGALVDYVELMATAHPGRGGGTTIELAWHTPWWAGVFGVSRARRLAGHFADTLEDVLGDGGIEVTDRDGA